MRTSIRSSTSLNLLTSAIAASLAGTFGGASAVAQEGAGATVLEEVVVTGRRREELLQDVPISIQAFSMDEMENRGIEGGANLMQVVPNLSIGGNALAGNQTSAITIRGITNVGLYVDGIWTPPRGFQDSNLVDFERVEILRGPQGTLFGRNTNGGAIQFITPPPGEELGGKFDVTVGEYGRQDLRATLDFPLGETLLSRFSVANLKSEGWLESVAVGNLAYGGGSDQSLRADILWRATDNFSARFTAQSIKSIYDTPRQIKFTVKNEPGRTFPLLQTAYNVAMRNPDFGPYTFWTQPFPRPTRQFEINQWTRETHESGYPGGEVGEWENRDKSPLGSQSYDAEQYTLTLDWNISDAFNIRSLSAYRDQRMRDSANYYASEVNPWQDTRLARPTGWSEELQLTGVLFDSRVDYLVGAYYSSERLRQRGWRYGHTDFFIMSDNPFDANGNLILSQVQRNMPLINFIRAWAVANGDAGLVNFNPFLPYTATFNDDTTKDWALFGEATWQVTDRWELTAGLRFSWDDGEQRIRQPVGAHHLFYSPNYGGAQFGPGPMWDGPVTFRQDRFGTGMVTTPAFSTSYRFNDDVMVFFRYAEGFTNGEEVFVPEIPELVKLDPEVVHSYELGLRSDWFNRTLRVNVTGFYGEWTGKRVSQQVVINAFDFFSTTRSAGDATVKGVEIETSFRPSSAWSFNANVAFLDTEYGELGVATTITKDTEWADSPKFTSSVGAQYDWGLSGGGEITFRTDVSSRSDYQWSSIPAQQATERLPGYEILNARVQYTPSEGNWYLALFGTNLTDTHYAVTGGTSTLYGFESYTPGKRRQLNLRFGMEF